jgi:hypothetical protein
MRLQHMQLYCSRSGWQALQQLQQLHQMRLHCLQLAYSTCGCSSHSLTTTTLASRHCSSCKCGLQHYLQQHFAASCCCW